MQLTEQIKLKEAEALRDFYLALPESFTSAGEKPLGKLLASYNLASTLVGKILTVLSLYGYTEHYGSRGGLTYRRTKPSIAKVAALSMVDKIHEQPGLADLTLLRTTRVKKKLRKIEKPILEEPKPVVQPKAEIEDKPTIQGTLGEKYFFIAPNNLLGYGRLETIQAVFDKDELIGYRYEIVNKDSSYIVENLYKSIIEASQNIIPH